MRGEPIHSQLKGVILCKGSNCSNILELFPRIVPTFLEMFLSNCSNIVELFQIKLRRGYTFLELFLSNCSNILEMFLELFHFPRIVHLRIVPFSSNSSKLSSAEVFELWHFFDVFHRTTVGLKYWYRRFVYNLTKLITQKVCETRQCLKKQKCSIFYLLSENRNGNSLRISRKE